MSNSSARRASNRALWALNKTFVEKQFYARRPQLRLPQTSATRSRRRKGGLGLFAQNSLRTPKTLTGLRSLLLPPARSVSLAQRRNVSPIGARFSDFSRVIQRADDYPRYFVRRRLR